MAHSNQNWDKLGRDIQDVVDRAVNSRDYQQLNKTICQVVDWVVDVGSDAVQRASVDVSKPIHAGTQDVRKLYGSTFGRTAKACLAYIAGISFSLFAFLALLGGTLSEEPITNYPYALAFMLMLLVTGIWLIYNSVKSFRMVRRFKSYRRTLGQRTYCSVEALARSVAKDKKFVQQDLRQMIGKGFFPEGHMDDEEITLIISHETYHYYEQCGQQSEEIQQQETHIKMPKDSASHDPHVQEVLDKGVAFVAQIRKCNDDIPGEEISEKISRIELLIQRIFNRAKAHPEVVPDLKKLMDYYLPMTVKLLNAYADMDAQPVQGETIENSKREIEATLDTLNLAFENLLDDLFADTAMDVSSDISVLNTLLAQEGLTEDGFGQLYQ